MPVQTLNIRSVKRVLVRVRGENVGAAMVIKPFCVAPRPNRDGGTHEQGASCLGTVAARDEVNSMS